MVNIDNKWVKACQTVPLFIHRFTNIQVYNYTLSKLIDPHTKPTQSIPSVRKGEMLSVTLRELKPEEKKAAFFSPKSLADGFFNNAAGMVGFASTASKVDESFEVRMKKEKELAGKLAALKATKKS